MLRMRFKSKFKRFVLLTSSLIFIVLTASFGN